ncbi:hypothetical protein BLNAU_10866 [Blattamonas nauphoetae]|uniref:Uncharacterized protein n=1 Tax=Blattamonas nauphoetae TaxID=2049346 RepID=A0ABQ9XQ70_9EUKA|nr:hypothetical protein BLNAU_10866 [Blattamonas nauphoetae]
MPTKSLWALFTPTRLHHAAATLKAFREFTTFIKREVLVQRVYPGWFSLFFDTVTPSTLPCTGEFIPLHTQLLRVMRDIVSEINYFELMRRDEPFRSELDAFSLAFSQQTKDYIVHLSLYPSALTPLSTFFLFGFKNFRKKPFRDDVREAMKTAALSLSSSPFILTYELVCCLPDDEFIGVVDRIVALLTSDCSVDDDSIHRIYEFYESQLNSTYLPEIFRKAGRTTEQYFFALNSLLSLPTRFLFISPILCLMRAKPMQLPPSNDEWDDVDLDAIRVVVRNLREMPLSSTETSSHLNQQLLFFARGILRQISNSATRLNFSQLERLITPSITILSNYCIQERFWCSDDRWF